jgi:hypothetical protein
MDGVDRHEIRQRAPLPLHVRLTHRYGHRDAEHERGNENMT